MKKILLLALVFISFFEVSKAQSNHNEAAGKIQALKIAYLTKKLEFTPEQAQKFWPLYNKYEAELKKTRMDMKGKNDELALDQKLVDVRKKYRKAFAEVMSAEKANRVFTEERAFNRQVQKELQERKLQRMLQQQKKKN